MSAELIRQLQRELGGPLNETAQPSDLVQCQCGPDPYYILKVAIIIKYGPNIRESAFKFVEETEAIFKKHGVNDEPPSISDKLEALKASVGEAMFEKLLSNPEVERMASRAYRRADEVKCDAALSEISALFNDAVDTEILTGVLGGLSEALDPVAVLAEA